MLEAVYDHGLPHLSCFQFIGTDGPWITAQFANLVTADVRVAGRVSEGV